MDTTYNTNNNFYNQRSEKNPKVNKIGLDYLHCFNIENANHLKNHLEEKNNLTKIISDIKLILKEGISKSKILVDVNNNVNNHAKPFGSPKNYVGAAEEFMNISNFNSNKSRKCFTSNSNLDFTTSNSPENEIIKAKKIEGVLGYCGLIDNVANKINKFLFQNNQKKLQNITNNNKNTNTNTYNYSIVNNTINNNDDTNTISNLNLINPLKFSGDFITENQNNNTLRSILKGSFLTNIENKQTNLHSNINLNQIRNFFGEDNREEDDKIDQNCAAYLQLESFQRKSIYKSLFKNCRNTLNEIILIYKSKTKEENLIMNESVSSVVNNMTNNINFNFNFNLPKYNMTTKSQEYKSMINNMKKEKSNTKDNYHNSNNQNNKMNLSKNSKNSYLDINKNNKIKNNINFQNNNFQEHENRNALKNSNCTDYSPFDEINENLGGFKISSFNNMPKNFFNYKTNNEKTLQSSKKRAKSLDSNIDDFNPAFNSNYSNKLILISSSTNNADLLNVLVNDENISSIKLPISKIRNVNLEDYNKCSKIFITKFVNLNSNQLFKRISTKNNQELENEFDMEVNVNNLNISYEMDDTSSKKLFANFFRQESKTSLNKILKNSINENSVFSKGNKKLERLESNSNNINNNNDFTFLFKKLTEANKKKNIEEEDDYRLDSEDSFDEKCNLNNSDDDEKNVYNMIKIRSKKFMQKFLFNSSNKNLILNVNNCLNNNRKGMNVSNFANLKDSHRSLFNNNEKANEKTFKSNFICESFLVDNEKKTINDYDYNNHEKNDFNILKSQNKIQNINNINSCNNFNETISSGIKNKFELDKIKKCYETMIAKEEYRNDIGNLSRK